MVKRTTAPTTTVRVAGSRSRWRVKVVLFSVIADSQMQNTPMPSITITAIEETTRRRRRAFAWKDSISSMVDPRS